MDRNDSQSNTTASSAPSPTVAAEQNRALPRRRRSRQTAFRLAAILLALSCFPLFELVCIVAGWGDLSVSDDPFVGFASIRPLFERTADGQHFHTSPARRGFFEEDSFLVRKPPEEFRIFVFGGSTVQGNPFSIETSFTRFLQLALTEADPSRSWEVVNCGGISYATYRLLPLMQECLTYRPDLYIVCAGHNEFLEDVSYASVRDTSTALTRTYAAASRFRSFRLLQRLIHWRPSPDSNRPAAAALNDGQRPVLPPEVDALLDHTGGLEAYRRDDVHARQVAQHFRSNLLRMMTLCRQHELPLLLIQPPTNLSDCPPFKAEFSDTVSVATVDEIRRLLDQASTVVATSPATAVPHLEEATRRDPRFAWSWYQLGHALLASTRFDEARRAFIRARDEDICPLRMTTPLEQAMQAVAAETGIPFLNAAEILQQECPQEILSDHILVDHIHPSFGGHQIIAVRIVQWMLQQNLATQEVLDWEVSSRRRFEQHVQSLDNMYFLKGRRRLQDLQGWAAGRSEGPPLIRPAARAGPDRANTSKTASPQSVEKGPGAASMP